MSELTHRTRANVSLTYEGLGIEYKKMAGDGDCNYGLGYVVIRGRKKSV
jgi:hypothetical protein